MKCLQAASQMMMKTAAGFLREALPASAGWTTGELLFISSHRGDLWDTSPSLLKNKTYAVSDVHTGLRTEPSLTIFDWKHRIQYRNMTKKLHKHKWAWEKWLGSGYPHNIWIHQRAAGIYKEVVRSRYRKNQPYWLRDKSTCCLLKARDGWKISEDISAFWTVKFAC